MELKKQK